MAIRSGVAALAAALITALAVTSSGFGQPAGSSPTAQVDATELASAHAHIGVLRESGRSGSDEIPATIAHGPLLSDGYVDLGSSHAVPDRGRQVWLASSSDGKAVCAVTSGAMACPPVEEVVERGLSPMFTTRAGEPVHVSGIAADSVTSVDVVLADNTRQTVSVSGNFFSLDLLEIPQGLRWQGPNGPESYEFPPVPRG